MKYEITQGQYVQFLNKLTSAQAVAKAVVLTAARNTISGSWPNFSASAPHRACTYMSAGTGSAYADWAGLRPMTEFEYEKACRGPLTPFPSEYAWGDSTLINAAGLLNDGLAGETASGNALVDGSPITGPLRNGWAGSMPATRANTGCTYYGIAEMTGNLREIVVRADAASGRTLIRTAHGDGNLSVSGDQNVSSWPTAGVAYTSRGGSWNTSAVDCHVSARDGSTTAQNGNWANGFRCVRTF
jgi:formylglycine-generating enzyme required for sulfatase activity